MSLSGRMLSSQPIPPCKSADNPRGDTAAPRAHSPHSRTDPYQHPSVISVQISHWGLRTGSPLLLSFHPIDLLDLF